MSDREQPDSLLGKAEDKWLFPLFDHCRELFSRTWIPSHDQCHHYRVWHYMKELLAGMNDAGIRTSEETAEKAIIAAFFHDTGLVRTLDESHGRAGRQLCLDYFRDRGSVYPPGIEEILLAIEKHDDKQSTHAGTGTDLLSILSTCDDLDAFGYIGAYRYAEIYLLRGTGITVLPSRVLSNLENRYRNLLRRWQILTSFVYGQQERYALTRDFYSSGENQRVLDFISRMIREQISLLDPELINKIHDEHSSTQTFIRQVQGENSRFPYP
jgi:hypothetical protein